MAKKKKKNTEQAKRQAQTTPGKLTQFKEFVSESQVEMKKVTWPSRKETLQTSGVVLLFVAVLALFFSLVDVTLAKLIEAILP
jgi:preprotein translocase subunit SecE